MAQYKVPQNVESEDKILGPLSLRQFIYVVIGLMWAALMWAIFRQIIVLAVVFALPVTGFFLLLGFGKREEQSFENYFVALLRFQFVPRKRIWMKDDKLEESVVTKEGKKEEQSLARNPQDVKGQLEKLSLVLDTHGGVNKDETLQLPEANVAADVTSRVIGPQASGQTPGTDLSQADLLDLNSNERAISVSQMLERSEANVRKQALAKMQQDTSSAANIQDTQSSQQTGENDIIKKVTYNPNLSVAQISNRANQEKNNQV